MIVLNYDHLIFLKEKDRPSPAAAAYRPRNPQLSDYYRSVEDYFETFIRIYDEHSFGQ